MKAGQGKRICAGLLAAVMAASLGSTMPVSARAEAAGNDGSAAMNEAYEAHESLMPVGPSFNIDTLLAWTPESDPDARYNRSSIPLADRVGGFVVNPKANPEAKLMLCSLANSDHDNTGAQGTENFLSWSFNYWQYTDSFVYWAGSEEGLVVCPTGEFTDAAHTNGVPVVATLGFPFGSAAGNAQQVAKFCRKAEDGSFPVADKLLEVMEYYGFDGYFFNQESYGCSPETARLLNEMMRYMRRKCPNILLSWYDSMVSNGSVTYGNAVNQSNKLWLERDTDGVYGVDEFFMNYDWYANEIARTLTTMESIGRNPYDAFAGLDVQQNAMDTAFRDHLLLDDDGRLKLSLALYCPNSTLGLAADGAAFHRVEQDFYTNTAADPRVETSDATGAYNKKWVGISRFFADKTPITKAPFVTNFNSGHGTGYWVDGVLSRQSQWSYQANQDVIPTWTWIIDSEGSKLEGGYDFTDAYNGGNSIQFFGSLNAEQANHIMLYSTHVAVEDGMSLRMTYKQTGGEMKLVAYYGDENTGSYADCRKEMYDLTAGNTEQWTTTAVDISSEAGNMLYAIGIWVASETDVEQFRVNLGQFAILNQEMNAPAAPEGVTLDEILYRDAYTAEARVYWDAVAGAASYEVYKVCADGSRKLIMETPNTALYLPAVARDAEEANVQLEVIAIGINGIRGQGQSLIIDWAHGNEDSQRNVAVELVNVCLNAEITGVSFENSGEPASKALDGAAANNSKWCATNKTSGWMSIDVGREVTIRRWRVEHAEHGGEANNMNTIDFALEYKDESGQWVQVMRIRDNHDAVTDVLLEEPVTARYWRLRVYDDGSSAWAGIRIYEWQMFESDQFPQTEPVMMHFASAVNYPGAHDSFTLLQVPEGQTVKLYTKNGDTYTQIAEQAANGTAVTFDNLDFGMAEAGRIYYTTTAAGSAESIKQSAAFEAENAPVSAPVSAVYFDRYSQPGSDSYIRGDMAYVTVTVDNLKPGDVVYVYEDTTEMWSKRSLPVAEGETSVSIDRVQVPWRGFGSLNIRVKRAGERISEMQTLHNTPYMGTMAVLFLKAWDAQGQELDAHVVYGVYDGNGEEVARISTASDFESGRVFVEGGSYTLKCLSVPEGYEVEGPTEMEKTFQEALTYGIDITLVPKKAEPVVSAVTITPSQNKVNQGQQVRFEATVSGSNLTDSSVGWSVSGATTADTRIDENGLLTVGADEAAAELIVTATSNQDGSQSMTAVVTVIKGELSETQPTVPDDANGIGDDQNQGSDDRNQGSGLILWILGGVIAAAGAAVLILGLKKKRK